MPGEAPHTGLPFPLGSDPDAIVARIQALAEAIVQVPLGSLCDWAGRGDPADPKWLAADGRAISRATYEKLFKEIVPGLGTVTITIASPAVFTIAAHELIVGDSIYLKTTGALPTGLSANTLYFVTEVPSSSTFKVATTRGGVNVNTSGSQSGVHSLFFCPFGLGDGSTTFNIPDSRGRGVGAPDNMTTAAGAAGRLTGPTNVPGSNTGTQTVTLTVAQMPVHAHGGSTGTGTTGTESATHIHKVLQFLRNLAGGGAVGYASGAATLFPAEATESNTTAHTHSVPKLTITSEGAGEAHSVMQPTLVATKIVRVL